MVPTLVVVVVPQLTETCLVFIPIRIPSAQIASGSRSRRKVSPSDVKLYIVLTQSVTFVDVTDPYAEDPVEPTLSSPGASRSAPSRADWGPDASYRSRNSDIAAHGLEALSAAASTDRASFAHPQPSHHDLASTAISYMSQTLHHSSSSPPSTRRQMHLHMPSSSTTSINSTNHINFLLNPHSSLSPPIDPSLRNPPEQGDIRFTGNTSRSEAKAEQPVDPDQGVAYLLRHFADAPGS